MYFLLGLCSVAFHSSAHSLIAVFTHGLPITQSHQQPVLLSATIQTESQTLPHFLNSPQGPSNNVLSSSWLLQSLLLWYLSLDHKLSHVQDSENNLDHGDCLDIELARKTKCP